MDLFEQDFLTQVQAVRPALQSHAWRLLEGVADSDTVEDLVEDVIHAAWRRLFQAPVNNIPIDNLSAWLNGAIRLRCLYHIRTMPPEVRLSDLALPDDTDDEVPDWERPHMLGDTTFLPYFWPRYDMKIDVRNAVDKLPPWAADLLIRKHVDGQTFAEIARETEMAMGSIHWRLAQAEELLAVELATYRRG